VYSPQATPETKLNTHPLTSFDCAAQSPSFADTDAILALFQRSLVLPYPVLFLFLFLSCPALDAGNNP